MEGPPDSVSKTDSSSRKASPMVEGNSKPYIMLIRVVAWREGV